MTDAIPLPFELPSVRRKKLTVDFDGGNQSSDAGVLLLRQAERKLGVCRRLADAMPSRQQGHRGSTGRPRPLAHRRMAAQYALELNDIEVVWHDLKAFNLAHKTFTDVDTLDAAIHSAVVDLNTERNRDLLGEQRISA
jgi:hypothetical protein